MDVVLQFAMAVAGIGLVIFVHEAGHFLAARLCKVRVEVFSLGFGPRLLGWRHGPTTYQIAAVPFGGYVRMSGDEVGRGDGSAPRPWELRAKSPGQRFFIYSGGVLMNVLFAAVVFPIVLFAGVPSLEPVIDAPAKGTSAWHARLAPGSRVLSINGHEIIDFHHMISQVAISGSRPVEVVLREPGSERPRAVELATEYHDVLGIYWTGFEFSQHPRLEAGLDVWGEAARAADLTPADRLLGVAGESALLPPHRQLELAFERRQVTPTPITLLVGRGEDDAREVVVEPRAMEEHARPVLGVRETADVVLALRDSALLRELGLRPGDRLLEVEGRPVFRSIEFLDALLAAEGELELSVEREGERLLLDAAAIDEAAAVALWQDVELGSPGAGWRASVSPGSAAEAAGLRSGDRVLEIDGQDVSHSGPRFIRLAQEATQDGDAVRLTIARELGDGELERVELEITPRPTAPPEYGFSLLPSKYVYRASGVGEAIVTGLGSSWRSLVDVWMTLRRITSGEVRSDVVGGIIMISQVSTSFASEGWAKLFFFLCMLSINLAVINVLPIPVLDGGHLFFILVEMIKGSPVSERTLGYSQVVGLVLLVSLMVYVTYNDIMRLF